jgi:threonine/homoserine/homoserine lactone efflux protein
MSRFAPGSPLGQNPGRGRGIPDSVSQFAVIGVLFAVLAAACAFVIAYSSYQNQFMDTRTPKRLALHTAGVTFLFFLVAAVALPWIFGALRHVGR